MGGGDWEVLNVLFLVLRRRKTYVFTFRFMRYESISHCVLHITNNFYFKGMVRVNNIGEVLRINVGGDWEVLNVLFLVLRRRKTCVFTFRFMRYESISHCVL